jgi:hypothetical protein
MAVKKTAERKKAVRRSKTETRSEPMEVAYIDPVKTESGKWGWQAKTKDGDIVDSGNDARSRREAWNEARKRYPHAGHR